MCIQTFPGSSYIKVAIIPRDIALFSLSLGRTILISMGLLRDAIGSALGANQLNNGLSGRPRLPFANDNSRYGPQPSSSGRKQSSSYNQGYAGYSNRKQNRRRSSDGNNFGSQPFDQEDRHYRAGQYQDHHYPSLIGRHDADDVQRIHNGYDGQISQSPPRYETCTSDGQGYRMQSYNPHPYGSENYTDNGGWSRSATFRPLALPQIAYGNGQPFLRGYSQELSCYDITMEDFMQVLDSINTAIIPSPENQIFQKGANIAGWFL